MTLVEADRPKLALLLDQLAAAIEDLLLTGLTTATETTRQSLAAALQEASRRQLLRLASTLRIANEELGRFTRNEPQFSRKRLLFFLNRAWLLARGLRRALDQRDQALYDRLLWTPASQAVERLEVVALGVGKKVAAGVFVAFDFRLRSIAAAATASGVELPLGMRLAWSCVFPMKPGVEVPPEGYLHLPQKQKFNATLFLERRRIVLEQVAVALDDNGGGRISLGDQSRVAAGEPFDEWSKLLDWNPTAAIERLAQHDSSPFDLEVELQEEVVLRDWSVGSPAPGADGATVVYPIACGETELDAVVSAGSEGESLATALDQLHSAPERPALFGLLHYENCRLLLQPLSAFADDRPDYLTISKQQIDRSQLLKALKF